ncbi:MAG: cob(I)yrinic acid a,c-diamide adenosyltransferase [Opitutaceae bacterium]|nr:cob(I)yrinic acid a,c-diamide adenosyltransferase [Opitutaceae bacterium]
MASRRQSSLRSIATRTGDDGTSSLLFGQRVPKDHPQIEAVGALDEFNAMLGLARATCRKTSRRRTLERIQHDLVALMGEAACAEADAKRYARKKFARLTAADLESVDAAITAIEAQRRLPGDWATPGANLHAAALDLARTSARRAERRLVALAKHGRLLRPLLLQYINRVSDLLWLMARAAES